MVIGEVSKLLRHTLWLGLQEDDTTKQLVTSEHNIVLTNPSQTSGVVRQLSLWLYQVLPNEHLRNPPLVRQSDPKNVGGDDLLFHPPLALNLFYLLTPSLQLDSEADPTPDQQLLGRAMQIFHDQSILRLSSKEMPDQADELHLSLAPRTIEELAEVWEAMQQPYRLSVCYEVRVVRIESQRRLPGGRVRERVADFAPAGA
jgi:hypothetical protein